MDYKSSEQYWKLNTEVPDVLVTNFYVEAQWQHDAVKYTVIYKVDNEKERKVSRSFSNETIASLYKSVSKNDLTNTVIKMLAMSVADDVAKDYKTNFSVYENVEHQIRKMVYPPIKYDGFSIGGYASSYSIGKAAPIFKEPDPNSPSEMSRKLPGMDFRVKCPEENCEHLLYSHTETTLYNLIQHLNDYHKWTREGQIADWLDDLHDKGLVDLSFKTPDK